MSSQRWPHVFLSYAREDSATAERVRPLLTLAGFGPSADSASLAGQSLWQDALERAVDGSDFVVALCSRHTLKGDQLRELRAAFDASRASSDARTPLLVPCALSNPRDGAFEAIVPDFLRQAHVVDLSRFDAGWLRLHASLYSAAVAMGLHVPTLLRATPVRDLDRAAVSRLVVEHGFVSQTPNTGGGRWGSDLTLAPDGLVVEDAMTARMWTRGCIAGSSLPSPPMESADEAAASLIPSEHRTAAQNELVAARRKLKRDMTRAIEEWTIRMNLDRYGGYHDWRLPTVEEAMSLMQQEIRMGGLYLSTLFSDHEYIRTADGCKAPELLGLPLDGVVSVWGVSFKDADCVEFPEEAPVPLRFVRTDLD
jgi:hypothetical protein